MYELCDSEEQLLVDSISFMSNSLSHVSKYFEAKLKYCTSYILHTHTILQKGIFKEIGLNKTKHGVINIFILT